MRDKSLHPAANLPGCPATLHKRFGAADEPRTHARPYRALAEKPARGPSTQGKDRKPRRGTAIRRGGGSWTSQSNPWNRRKKRIRPNLPSQLQPHAPIVLDLPPVLIVLVPLLDFFRGRLVAQVGLPP